MPTSRSATKSTTTDKPKTPTKPKSPSRRKSPTRIKNATSSSVTRTIVTRQWKEEENIKLSPPPLSSTPKVPSRRSPIRKSPTRTSKLKQNVEKFYSEARPWQSRKSVDVDTDSDSAENKMQIKEKPKATVRARTRNLDDQYDETDDIRDSVTKDLYRRSTSHDIERIIQLRHFNTYTRKLGEFSDDDDHQYRKYEQTSKTEQTKRQSPSIDRFADKSGEFGGPLGVLLLMISAILSLLYLYIMCNNVQCTYTQLPDLKPYHQLSTYFNAISILGLIIYLSFIAILSVIPFGGKRVYGLPNRQGKLFYVLNGLFIMVVMSSIAIGLEYYGIGLFDFLVEHTFHLLISAMIIGFLLSNYVYIRSFYVPLTALNMHVINKNPIYAYFLGRELNPRAFNLLDIKMFVLRSAIFGTVIMDFVYLYKNLDVKISDDFEIQSFNIRPTLFLFVLLHTIYLLDPFVFEEAWLTTFETQYEGCGFMTAFGHLIYPFMMISMTKYIVDFNIELIYWRLILIGLQFLVGLVLFRGSNNQKDAFRRNPYNPTLAHLETIPTGHGKKLICSGYWGIVRHPNYLGDILMNLCFAWFAPFVLPSIPYYCIVVLLIHRSVRDNYRCKQKYGSAWTRYCNRVKYILIPRIY